MKPGGLLRCSSANPHGPGGAINTIHLSHGAVPLILIREFNESVALGAARVGVRNDLGAPHGRVLGPESLLEEVIGDVRGQVAHEDGVVGPSIGPALTDAEGGPIEPEVLLGAGHEGAIVGVEHALCGRVGDELDEAVAFGVAGDLVADDLDRNDVAGVGEAVGEVGLVDPVLEVAYP